MRPKDIPLQMWLSSESVKRTVILIQDSLKLPYPNCWNIKQKNDTLTFKSFIDTTHENGYRNPDDWRIQYRRVHGSVWMDEEFEKLILNPIEIMYRYDTFYPWSTRHFFEITAFMKYFIGFEITD